MKLLSRLVKKIIEEMEHLKPKELLKQRLNEYEKALQKSFESYQKNNITLLVHKEHKTNLELLIFQYKQALEILNQWLD